MNDANTFLQLLTTGQYLPAVGIALIAVVAVARFTLAMRWPWFSTKVGGYVLGFGSATVLYVGAAWRDGAGMSVGLFAAALAAGWVAAGGWETLRDILGGLRTKAPPTSTVLVVAAALLLGVSSCRHVKGAGVRAAQGFVDCMQPSVVKTALELKPTYRELLELATGGDGKVDREALKAAAAGLKTPALRCAFSTVVAEAMHAVTNAAGGVQSAPLEVDKEDLAATFEAIRAESFAGERYKLESGVL